MKVKPPIPPKSAEKLLIWILKDDLVEEVLGDLEEKFCSTAESKSIIRAKWNYWYQVFNYLRPFALRRSNSRWTHHLALLRFNLIFTFRNMRRHKYFTLLNVIGLALGIASCLFISLFILDELSYDQHWTDGGRIYRAYVNIDHGDTHLKYGFATAPFADIFEEEFPEVELAARWSYARPVTFKIGDELIRETKYILADQNIIPMFSLEVLSGNKDEALTKPNTIVLTESGADKYFGDENPVGKVMTSNDGRTFEVTCVIRDFPPNSHFNPTVIGTTINDQWSDPSKVTRLAYWTISAYRTYLKLKPGVDHKELELKFHSIYEKYLDPAMRDWSGQSWKEFIDQGNQYYYALQPLTDIYLHSDFSAGDSNANKGDIKYIYMFGVIGAFIMLIAMINFINLTTSRSTERLKEIGIKKILGSSGGQIFRQFILESLLLALLAFALATMCCYLLLPTFNQIISREFEDPMFNRHQLWLYGLIGTISLGFSRAFIHHSCFQKSKT